MSVSFVNDSIKKILAEKNFAYELFISKPQGVPSEGARKRAEKFINDIYVFLFLGGENGNVLPDLENEYDRLKYEYGLLLAMFDSQSADTNIEAGIFFRDLPHIYKTLLADAKAVIEFDPAAQSLEEVFFTYPGFFAVAVYRLAHLLNQVEIKILPRLFTEFAHSKTGIDIHPAAEIGASFFIDHGTGIVIGETATVGNNVKIYQGVTLGALNVSKENAHKKRHPTIEDDVIIYSGATILGGETVIGKSSIIGGNVWLTNSVPPHSVVYHKSEIKVRDNNPFPEPLNFVI